MSLHAHIDHRIIPADSPAAPPASTGVVVDIHNLPTESHPSISLTNLLSLTDEPYVIGLPTSHLSPASAGVEGSSQLPRSASSVISDLHMPEGRYLQLINSDQVPRCTKDIGMQVNGIMLLF
jgi:hypothetical protein